MGYHAVAINHKVEGKLPKGRCPFGKIDYSSPLGTRPLLRQYSRLTLILSDPQQNYGINSGNEVIKSYDIVAVQPETEKMFISACTTLDVDLISLDFTSRLSFPIKAGYVRQAMQRGIAFEVLYGPFLADMTARRNIIGNVRMLLRFALSSFNRNGTGIVVSSGAEGTWQLRAPFDVMNLTSLMGVPAHLQKNCVSRAAEHVFLHAATRKHTHRAAIAIVSAMEDDTSKTTTTDMLEDFLAFK